MDWKPFLGRDVDLAWLDTALQASEEIPVMAVVHGAPGVGKTALLQQFLQRVRARGRTTILSSRCHALEAGAYGALDGVIDGVARAIKLRSELVGTLSPEELRALVRVFVRFEFLGAGAPPSSELEPPDPRELRRRAFGALKKLICGISARSPVVLALDDVQWCDPDSVRLVVDLFAPPSPPRLLFVTTHRRDGARERTAFAELSRLTKLLWVESAMREHLLGPLPDAKTRELVLALLARDDDDAHQYADRVAREADGNPFFVELRHLDAVVPLARCDPPGEGDLDALVLTRVCALDAPARRLLEVVAVAGGPVEQSIAADAAHLSEHERSAWGVLQAGGLVHVSGPGERDRLEPLHDTVRDAVLRHLDQKNKMRLHRSLALALERAGAGDMEAIAIHYREGGEPARAAQFALKAADRARDAVAFDRAAELYGFALESPGLDEIERRRLRVLRADALVYAGHAAEAARVYLEAAQGASEHEALALQRRAAEEFLRGGDIDRGLELVPVVLSAVNMRFPETPRRALADLFLHRARLRLRGLEFRERPASELGQAELFRVDTCWLVALGLATVDTVRGAGFQARHLIEALRSGEPYRVCRALAIEAGYLAMQGGATKQRAEQIALKAEALAARVPEPHAAGLVALGSGVIAAQCGEWRRALERCERAEHIFRERCRGVTWEIGTAARFSLLALFYLGEVKEVGRRSRAHLHEALELGDRYTATLMRIGTPNISQLALDDVDSVRRDAREAMRTWARGGFQLQHFFELLSDTMTDLYAGDPKRAFDRVNDVWPALRGSLVLRAQLVRILALQLRAQCALSLARATGSTDLVRRAQRDADRILRQRMPWAEPVVLLLQAGAARVLERPERAVALLSRAEQAVKAADMGLLAAPIARVRGALLRGEEGNTLVAFADQALAQQGIRNPARWTSMLMPGFA